MNIPQLIHHNPFLDPAWRSVAARHLVAQGKRPWRRDDGFVWRLWRYLCGLACCKDEQQRSRVRRRDPDLAAAVELRESTDAFGRWLIEARLLAGESFAAIAEKSGLTAAAVAAYSHAYFDVAARLNARYWIVNVVIRYPHARDAAEDDVETLLKLFGFRGGPIVLDSLIDFFRVPEPVPADVADVPAERRARTALHLRIRAALAALCAAYGDARVEQFSVLADCLEASPPVSTEDVESHIGRLLQQAGVQEGNAGAAEHRTCTRRAG